MTTKKSGVVLNGEDKQKIPLANEVEPQNARVKARRIAQQVASTLQKPTKP